MARMTRAARIKSAAALLYGERWQSPLARVTEISQGLLQKLGSEVDPRTVTDDVYRRVAMALLSEAAKQRKAADRVEEIAGAMLKELEK